MKSADNIPKKKRTSAKHKVQQLRVKSKTEFNKFEKNIPQLIQVLKTHSVTKHLRFSAEMIKDPLTPKIRFKYGKKDQQSETEITVEPGSFEFDFEDGFKKIHELTAYKAAKLLQEQIIAQAQVWKDSITLLGLSHTPRAPEVKSQKKSLNH
jgi:hypothetical protein